MRIVVHMPSMTEKPELKGPIQSSSLYKDYEKEYLEKYGDLVAVHNIMESLKKDFREKENHASKGKDIEKQSQIGKKHKRLMKIYYLLWPEVENLKKMLMAFNTSHAKVETGAEIHPIEQPCMSEFTGVMMKVNGPVTAAKTIYEDEEGYLIIVTLPLVDPLRVNVEYLNHGIVKISSVSTSSMPFIQRNGRTFKVTDPAPEHCPPGEFQRKIQLPTRILEGGQHEVYSGKGGTMLEIKVPKEKVMKAYQKQSY